MLIADHFKMKKLIRSMIFNFLAVIVLSTESSTSKLKEVFNWKQLDFQYPNDGMRQEQIKSGGFNQESVIPLGVEVWKRKLFVTLPRLKAGVPATLTYVNLDDAKGNKSPKLIPYPDWETHQTGGKGFKIISVHHVNVDACDRLWMFDTGMADYLGEQKQVLPPRILVYNLKTDKLIEVHEIKIEHRRGGGCLASLASVVVDVSKDKCDDAFAYVSDSDASGFVAYNLRKKVSWRINEPFYRFEALPEDENSLRSGGVYGIGLKSLDDQISLYYFHPLSREPGSSITTFRDKIIEYTNNKYKVVIWQGPETKLLGIETDIPPKAISKDTNNCSVTEHLVNTKMPFFPSDVTVDEFGNVYVLWSGLTTTVSDEKQQDATSIRILMTPAGL